MQYSVHIVYSLQIQCMGKGSSSMEVFQSSGFRDWKNAMGNKGGVIVCHHNSRAHMEATSKAMSYKSVIEGKAKDIRSCL